MGLTLGFVVIGLSRAVPSRVRGEEAGPSSTAVLESLLREYLDEPFGVEPRLAN
jgi:hypothetical protein